LAQLITEGTHCLRHANRILAQLQEGMDRLRHTIERIERVIALLQPAATVSGVLTGVRRAFSGRRQQTSEEGEAS
jgi:hypothetical protein